MPESVRNGYLALVVFCCFALCVIAFLSFTYFFSKGYQSADHEHGAYYAKRDQAEISYRECLNSSASLNSARECINNASNGARESERAEQDLNAQREMADWAEGMLWTAIILGILSLLATVVGVRYVYLTFVATREMAIAQSRAYIHADKVEFFWGGKAGHVPRIDIWVVNTGQTPAKWYKIRVKTIVYSHKTPSEAPQNWADVDLPEVFDGPWAAIAPGKDGNKSTFYLADQSQEIIKTVTPLFGEPEFGFAIFGEVQYCTFFGEVFMSQFCFGRETLPQYKIARTEVNEVSGFKVHDNVENPVPLARYAFDLDVYKYTGNE